jgi:hypothetical protein
MGLWSVWVQWRMVSDPVAKGVGRVPHSCQGGHGHSAMGGPWQSTIVLVRSDNAAALTSGTARDPVLMHLWRCLQFFLAHYDIHLHSFHSAAFCLVSLLCACTDEAIIHEKQRLHSASNCMGMAWPLHGLLHSWLFSTIFVVDVQHYIQIEKKVNAKQTS